LARVTGEILGGGKGPNEGGEPVSQAEPFGTQRSVGEGKEVRSVFGEIQKNGK